MTACNEISKECCLHACKELIEIALTIQKTYLSAGNKEEMQELSNEHKMRRFTIGDMIQKRKVDNLQLQETKWAGHRHRSLE